MGSQRPDFTEFYQRSRDKCLRAVLVSVGDQDTAQDIVDEAFARAWASWRTASSPGVQLAAWTVTRQADGNIKITFREATDAAGLQRTLRADGVPVSVTFTGQQNPACQPYPSGGSPAFRPFGPRTGPLDGSRFAGNPKEAYETPYALVIDPSALPHGAGLQIWVSGTPGAADNFQLGTSLVKASPQCTGS